MGSLVRLKKRREFIKIAEQGQKYVTSGLILQALFRSEDAQFQNVIRVGFTTSRKIGNAVKRNRVRRRLREVARLVLPQYGVPGMDYVLIGRARTVDLPFTQLIENLKEALNKVKETS